MVLKTDDGFNGSIYYYDKGIGIGIGKSKCKCINKGIGNNIDTGSGNVHET